MTVEAFPCPVDRIIGLTPGDLGRLMPMFLWLDPAGTIRALGPTLAKILGEGAVVGTPQAMHFQRCPAEPSSEDGARATVLSLAHERRVALRLVSNPAIVLRGAAIEVGCGPMPGVLLNLGFGIHLVEAVRDFDLTEADFAPSDLAMELLYLREAKAAVLDELRALTMRLEAARRSALNQALTDALTGVANRRAFEVAFEAAVQAQARGGTPFAVIVLDLDFFKEVNDVMGHAAGDLVLSHAAQVLRDETRRGDVVARTGGDEFVLLLRGPIARDSLQAMARRIITRLEEPQRIEGEELCVSASLGIACSAGRAGDRIGRVLADADAALYASKRAGRGRSTIHGLPSECA